MTTTFRLFIAACTLTAAAVPAAAAPLGQHPAVVVKRLQAQASYDYVSKFYPHPAWLYLLPQSPDEAIAVATHDSGRRMLAQAEPLLTAQRAAQIDSQPDVR